MEHLKRTQPAKEREQLLKDLRLAPAWMHPLFRELAGMWSVKLEFLNRSTSEQAVIVQETAARRGLLPVMVEKDLWVSWILAVLFAHPEFGGQLVFKGGTSLSKVFGVIERFSEDIDLSVSPAFLGISEAWLEEAGSRNRRTARMEELEAACIERVRERFLPELERIAVEALGGRPGGEPWMGEPPCEPKRLRLGQSLALPHMKLRACASKGAGNQPSETARCCRRIGDAREHAALSGSNLQAPGFAGGL